MVNLPVAGIALLYLAVVTVIQTYSDGGQPSAPKAVEKKEIEQKSDPAQQSDSEKR